MALPHSSLITHHSSLIELELASAAFSGPLALLLELIESRRLPITQVSLAEVADQYLERMKSLVGLDPEILADFLVIAARLLVIKSRALLPPRPSVADEPDLGADLQQRLLEYRLFRDAAEQLRRLEENGRSYPRQATPEMDSRPEPPLEPVPPEALRAAMIRMLKALREKPREEQTLPPRVSVHERISYLRSYLEAKRSAVFSEVAGATVQEVVATFLALLELLRRGVVAAHQEEAFAEIRVTLVENEPVQEQ